VSRLTVLNQGHLFIYFCDYPGPTQSEGGDEEDEDKDEDADKSTWVSAPLTAKTLQRWLSSQVVQADVIAGSRRRSVATQWH
jgi:hypothetical protein